MTTTIGIEGVGQAWGDGELIGSTDVIVTSLAPQEGTPQLEVHYRPGSRAPRVGERLGTWVDGRTRYALAPRR